MRFDDLTITHTQTIVTQATDYGVWGDVLRKQVADEFKYRYGYQGQYSERDEETNWNHFELREYDAVIGRTHTIDPARQFNSPYSWVGNNPISGTDPTGGLSPIYDRNGKFLGTDDQGFKGDILIFDDPSKFTQGMKHEDALSVGQLINAAKIDVTAATLIFNHIVGVYKEFNLNFLHNRSFSGHTGDNYDRTPNGYNDPASGWYEARTHHKGSDYQSKDWGEIKVSFDWRGKSNSLLGTVENVVNALGVHEFQAHGRMNLTHPTDNTRILELQKSHWSWKNTTPAFKQHMIEYMSK